jgi:membrane protein implicated in regulation of membrane protease activity
MWWEFAIYIALALGSLYLLIWQRPFVKKYWKVIGAILILVVVIVFIIARIVAGRRNPTETGNDLQGAVSNVRESIEEANMEAAVRIAAARAKDQVKVEELKQVMAMKDKVARRKRLAQLVG